MLSPSSVELVQQNGLGCTSGQNQIEVFKVLSEQMSPMYPKSALSLSTAESDLK